MEDWDARPPAGRPQPGVPWHLVALAGIGALLLLALFAAVLVRIGSSAGPSPADRRWAGPEADAGAPADGEVGEEQAADLVELLNGDRLFVAHPSPLNLAAGETLVLRSRNDVVRVTPGPVTAAGGDCGAVTMAVAVEAGRRLAEFGPSAFRLRSTEGVDLPAVDCGAPPVPGSVTLTVAAIPAQLVYGPDGGAAQAVWLLR